MGINLIALLWGLAEATLFFIVPDVWLSAISLASLKKAFIASLFCLTGALLGGIGIYLWGLHGQTAAIEVISRVPAVNMEMLVQVQQDLSTEGILAIFFGPLSGTPYKTYAVQAASAGVDWLPFLLISIPARLLRFLAVILLCWAISSTLLRHVSQRTKYCVLLAGWLLFYSCYFAKMLV